MAKKTREDRVAQVESDIPGFPVLTASPFF